MKTKSKMEYAIGRSTAEIFEKKWAEIDQTRKRLESSAVDVQDVKPDPITFPIEVFPAPIANFVEAVAECMPCSLDMIGCFTLGVISGIIGNARRVQVKKSWKESCLLWVAVISDPSTKKSPTLNIAMAPVFHRQEVIKSDYKTEDDEKPMLQLYATDCTIESVAKILKHQPRGFIYCKDELSSWVSEMNQYKAGKGNDKDQWLSIWGGGPIMKNRAKSPVVYVQRSYVAVIGGIQPERVSNLKSVDHDGFINRILFCYPDPNDHPIGWRDEEMPEEVLEEYLEWCHTLFKEFLHYNEFDEDLLSLEPEAKDLFKQFYNELEEKAKNEENKLIKASLTKLEGYTARFALVIQLSNYPQSTVVSYSSMKKAISLSRYFIHHLYRAFDLIAEGKDAEELRQIISRIEEISERNGRPGIIKSSEYVKAKIGGCRKSADAVKTFRMLEAKGYGKVEEVQNASGGRPTIQFALFSED